MSTSEVTPEMRQCLENCIACHLLCIETMAHVMHGGHVHSEVTHLTALQDCAQICMLHADFMMRRSPHQAQIAEECADICDRCARLCEEHQDRDGEMKRCGEACRKCQISCAMM